MCCHTETEVADQTVHLTQSHYTDTRPTSPFADPITPGAWQDNHRSTDFQITGMTRPGKRDPRQKRGMEPRLEADALPTRPTRRSHRGVRNTLNRAEERRRPMTTTIIHMHTTLKTKRSRSAVPVPATGRREAGGRQRTVVKAVTPAGVRGECNTGVSGP